MSPNEKKEPNVIFADSEPRAYKNSATVHCTIEKDNFPKKRKQSASTATTSTSQLKGLELFDIDPDHAESLQEHIKEHIGGTLVSVCL